MTMTSSKIMSKKTYKTEAAAGRAGEKDRGGDFIGTYELPSGRFCYVFVVYVEEV